MLGMVINYGDCYAYEELDLTDDTAQSVTASNLQTSNKQQAKYALVSVTAQTINFRMDGGTPTNTAGTDDGHAMVAGTSFVIEGHNNIVNFKAINRVATADGVVRISFFSGG